jgi:hypothetical protein
LIISPTKIEENANHPKQNAPIGWVNSSGLTRAYFIIARPSFIVVRHERWSIRTVKNNTIWTSVGLYAMGTIPQKIKITIIKRI